MYVHTFASSDIRISSSHWLFSTMQLWTGVYTLSHQDPLNDSIYIQSKIVRQYSNSNFLEEFPYSCTITANIFRFPAMVCKGFSTTRHLFCFFTFFNSSHPNVFDFIWFFTTKIDSHFTFLDVIYHVAAWEHTYTVKYYQYHFWLNDSAPEKGMLLCKK